MAAEKLPDIASRLITSQFPGDDFSFLEPERLGTAHVEFHSLGSSATIAVGCRYDHLRSRSISFLILADKLLSLAGLPRMLQRASKAVLRLSEHDEAPSGRPWSPRSCGWMPWSSSSAARLPPTFQSAAMTDEGLGPRLLLGVLDKVLSDLDTDRK